MTIEPISDERLAEIRAGLEGVTLKEAAHAAHAAFQAIIRREHPYLPPVRPLSEEKQYLQDAYEEMVKEAAAVYAPALLSRLYKAEGRDRTQATFEVCQDGAPVAMASGPRERAYAEAMHYVAVYGQDGLPIELYEHVPVALPPPPSES